MTFGLITEGPTDQAVIKHLLARYFIDPDIDTRPVQPNTDSTDKRDHFGGWKNVLNYCESPEMKTALEAYDYVVVQIDTDVCEDYGVARRKDGEDLSEEEVVSQTQALISGLIGDELYAQYQGKIIFAISNGSIECWLLPLYFNDNNRKKTVNCCEKLNKELVKEGFTLDCDNKKEKYFQKICKRIRNKQQIESIAVHNHSFSLFVQRLATL